MPPMSPYLTTTNGALYHATAEQVYPLIEPGSVSLVISDGPYNMRKAEWDKFKTWADFVDWYVPHIEAWGRACAPSATVYLWGSDESEGYLRAPMRAAGWTFKGSLVWDKGVACMAGKMDTNAMRGWYDVTERCGVYQREEWAPNTCAGQEIAYAAGRSEGNWIRLWLGEEWAVAGLRRKEADEALGTNGMASHYFSASQWSLPTWDAYRLLHNHAQKHGEPRERPYFVHPSVWSSAVARASYDHLRASHDHLRASYDHLRASYDHLRAEYDHLRAEYDHLRAEYEASRPVFSHPIGVGNVWSHLQVTGSERIRKPAGDALHPCQKPLSFYRRMIEASAAPGALILEPFGGTCRAAVACERLPEPRRWVCSEPHLPYLEAVAPSLRFEAPKAKAGQVGLFG